MDETVNIDPSTPVIPVEHISPALTKAMEIGSLCNNATMTRNENGEYVGQSTDVALLNVLDVFGIPDQRQVRSELIMHCLEKLISLLWSELYPAIRTTIQFRTKIHGCQWYPCAFQYRLHEYCTPRDVLYQRLH